MSVVDKVQWGVMLSLVVTQVITTLRVIRIENILAGRFVRKR